MDKLKAIRKLYGYSGRIMANKLEISATYYWQIENERRSLSYLLAFKISSILNTTPDFLFYEHFKNKV